MRIICSALIEQVIPVQHGFRDHPVFRDQLGKVPGIAYHDRIFPFRIPGENRVSEIALHPIREIMVPPVNLCQQIKLLVIPGELPGHDGQGYLGSPDGGIKHLHPLAALGPRFQRNISHIHKPAVP